MTRLSDAPFIHPTAQVTDSVLGRYTEIGEGCHIAHTTMGDYSCRCRSCEGAWDL